MIHFILDIFERVYISATVLFIFNTDELSEYTGENIDVVFDGLK